MARPRKYAEPTQTICIRLPVSVLNHIQQLDLLPADFFMNLYKDVKMEPSVIQNNQSINAELKQSIQIVVELFKKSVEIKKFADSIAESEFNAIDQLERII